MSSGDDKLVRVRGGVKGFRLIRLGDWKDENNARRGKLKPKQKSRQQARMEAKQRRRNEKRGKP
ncbi:MAG: hypothetical protein ACYTFQ_25995 [Planctomycetota bacterium]